ncbi:nuclear transport factor 2 family protein [Amycolatopsis mongoliensis]|uniref:Nuclear transport factor 2 family protein n=1 Tax=Amycolatopsis mongoliensis TaxID=715475 RepID=A0A9Y2JMP3_9PSEU|nr:nuclear transport factor 2 family protein [Amycolatopsis sp. 4-36]WIY00144.1 nuclear transport factor 2 family protein [Amycolatopsis sp. 4-36]
MPSPADEFLADVLPRQNAAERAIHNGDAGPRTALWSKADPVSLFGAWLPIRTGWADVSAAFRRVAAHFSDSREYRFEVVAAGTSGDLAYTIGFEHNTVSVDGRPKTYTLRVTHVYRREDGEWKIVHRHGDRPPDEPGPKEILTAAHSR